MQVNQAYFTDLPVGITQVVDITEKIKLLRASMKLSQKEFGERIGFSESKIQNMENGKQRINHEFLQALLVEYDADLNDLLSPDARPAALQGVKDTSSGFVSIPRYTVDASAGPGALVENEEQSGFYAFNRKWLERRSLKPSSLSVIAVRGDSMEPKLEDGDLILIDRSQRQIADGISYVVRLDTDLLVKYIQRVRAGVIALLSENRRYPPREIDVEGIDGEIEIIGRVVASMHEW